MAKHYATKVSTIEEKNDYLATIENSVTVIEDMDFSYLSTAEQVKLANACKKLHSLIDEVSIRMDRDIENLANKGEQKEKLKEVNQKLKKLSPEHMDKLLSSL